MGGHADKVEISCTAWLEQLAWNRATNVKTLCQCSHQYFGTSQKNLLGLDKQATALTKHGKCIVVTQIKRKEHSHKLMQWEVEKHVHGDKCSGLHTSPDLHTSPVERVALSVCHCRTQPISQISNLCHLTNTLQDVRITHEFKCRHVRCWSPLHLTVGR